MIIRDDELGFRQELNKTFIEGPSLEDCSEEISNIEDTYLKNVKSLKGYSWDDKRLEASVDISDFKKLKIAFVYSGEGCHFKLSFIKFIVPNSFSYQENKKEVIDDFLWISELVLNEEEYNLIFKTLNTEAYLIANVNEENDFISLFDEEKLESVMAFFEKKEKNNVYSILYLFK